MMLSCYKPVIPVINRPAIIITRHDGSNSELSLDSICRHLSDQIKLLRYRRKYDDCNRIIEECTYNKRTYFERTYNYMDGWFMNYCYDDDGNQHVKRARLYDDGVRTIDQEYEHYRKTIYYLCDAGTKRTIVNYHSDGKTPKHVAVWGLLYRESDSFWNENGDHIATLEYIVRYACDEKHLIALQKIFDEFIDC